MIRGAPSPADRIRASATYLRRRYPRRNAINPATSPITAGVGVMAGHLLWVGVRRVLSVTSRCEWISNNCSPVRPAGAIQGGPAGELLGLDLPDDLNPDGGAGQRLGEPGPGPGAGPG